MVISLKTHAIQKTNLVICLLLVCFKLINFSIPDAKNTDDQFYFEFVAGSFGTVILQLPLEGGHEGGRCKVEYKGISKIFESHENSDQLFYLSAFYGDCKHVMEPVTRGWKLVLVFNLVWEDAKISETLQDFPTFLGAVKEVQKALTSLDSSRKRQHEN